MKARYTYQQTVKINRNSEITVTHDYEHSAPLSVEQRMQNYLRQNSGRRLTYKQVRQLAKQELRLIARTGRSS